MNIGCIYTVDDFSPEGKILPSFASIPFGLSYIAAALQQTGHHPKILVFNPQNDVDDLVKRFIAQNRPKLFCLSAVSSQYPLICRIAKAIKQLDASINIILGGPYATLNPDKTIAEASFDAICLGEGEQAIVEYAACLAQGKQPAGIQNLWIKHDNGLSIEKNPQAPFIQDLDRLPYIDRSLWEEWIADTTRMATILLGRGCPNQCTYCSNHALAKVSQGKYVRFRSPENIIKELDRLLEQYPAIHTIHFEVETFGVNRQYIDDLLEHLQSFNAKRKRPIAFGTNLALTHKIAQNEELLRKLKETGFAFLSVGLESGSERVRQDILKRPRYANQDIIDFCASARKYGIAINLFVMMGFPGETFLDFQQTVACVRACRPDNVLLSIFYPYPGTDLYVSVKDMGLLDGEMADPTLERRKAVLDLPGFSRRRIQWEYMVFPWRVYHGNTPLLKIMALMARQAIGISRTTTILYRNATNYNIVQYMKKKFSPFYQ